MAIYGIPADIRSLAREIGKGRAHWADEFDRESYFEAYTNFERNFQGAIAEVYIQRLYPQLRLSNPYILPQRDVTDADFIYEDLGIELKCRRIRRGLPPFGFFKNVDEHNSKGHLAKILIGTAINGPPDRAQYFRLFGWIPTVEIHECRIYTSEDSPGIISPAYGIPFERFRDMKDLPHATYSPS